MRSIDWAFIYKLEGRRLEGYVPRGEDHHPLENSGVTVATGVDIGQRDRAEIIRLFIPDELKRKLLPYVLLKGQKALLALKLKPLKITDNEATELDRAIFNVIVNRVEDLYNKDSCIAFDRSPAILQTVIASLAWNFGPNLNKMPDLWSLIVSHDYARLAEFLENFPGKQKELDSRRDKEAALIKKLIV